MYISALCVHMPMPLPTPELPRLVANFLLLRIL